MLKFSNSSKSGMEFPFWNKILVYFAFLLILQIFAIIPFSSHDYYWRVNLFLLKLIHPIVSYIIAETLWINMAKMSKNLHDNRENKYNVIVNLFVWILLSAC